MDGPPAAGAIRLHPADIVRRSGPDCNHAMKKFNLRYYITARTAEIIGADHKAADRGRRPVRHFAEDTCQSGPDAVETVGIKALPGRSVFQPQSGCLVKQMQMRRVETDRQHIGIPGRMGAGQADGQGLSAAGQGGVLDGVGAQRFGQD